jgi:hypothetical protein
VASSKWIITPGGRSIKLIVNSINQRFNTPEHHYYKKGRVGNGSAFFAVYFEFGKTISMKTHYPPLQKEGAGGLVSFLCLFADAD